MNIKKIFKKNKTEFIVIGIILSIAVLLIILFTGVLGKVLSLADEDSDKTYVTVPSDTSSIQTIQYNGQGRFIDLSGGISYPFNDDFTIAGRGGDVTDSIIANKDSGYLMKQNYSFNLVETKDVQITLPSGFSTSGLSAICNISGVNEFVNKVSCKLLGNLTSQNSAPQNPIDYSFVITANFYKSGYGTTYYHFENNKCTIISIPLSQKTENDFDTLSECQSMIQKQPNIFLIIISITGFLIIVAGLVFLYLKTKGRKTWR
jgi:hypothetical protein